MVGSSYDQKPYRRSMMETWGATVHRSPSEHAPRPAASQAAHPTGSLGIAISEAVEVAAAATRTRNYALGSVLNHVLLHQTVIGQEAMAQMEMAGDDPDVVIGCVGGGSNFAGLAFPFLRANCATARAPASSRPSRRPARRSPAASTATTSATRSGMTPLMPMYTLGHDFVPPPVHAGGLRYHGDAPLVCGLVKAGRRGARVQAERDVRRGASTSRGPRGSSRRRSPRTRSAR